REKTDKPIVGALMGGQLEPEALNNLKEAGVPNYFDPARAVRALSALVEYGDIQGRDRSTSVQFTTRRKEADQKIERLKESESEVIGLEGMEVLEDYGIPTIPA
ncbi:MAG: CoA-binding protein, partial [Candidatus Bipolaricaulia bacterium]